MERDFEKLTEALMRLQKDPESLYEFSPYKVVLEELKKLWEAIDALQNNLRGKEEYSTFFLKNGLKAIFENYMNHPLITEQSKSSGKQPDYRALYEKEKDKWEKLKEFARTNPSFCVEDSKTKETHYAIYTYDILEKMQELEAG